ncbi:uncharacterized protein FTOL_12157 [Fusarium torulosum]|uniref:Uncharacterized protein n=1 Tax=Fusarium torulosum TaxID=33205 RepID=A0AAE8MJM7_9HYPO|nr:uncharacterized protein FTOL_12157 [Fusarium torulosum]
MESTIVKLWASANANALDVGTAVTHQYLEMFLANLLPTFGVVTEVLGEGVETQAVGRPLERPPPMKLKLKFRLRSRNPILQPGIAFINAAKEGLGEALGDENVDHFENI